MDRIEDIKMEQDLQASKDEYERAEKLVQQKIKKIRQLNQQLDPEKLQGVFPFCYTHVAIGNSRAGKTRALFDLLQKESGFKILDRILSGNDIYILSPTAHLDDSMQRIVALLKKEYKDFGDDQIYTDIETGVQAVQNRMKSQLDMKALGKEVPYLMCIIDDCISEFKTKYFQKFLEKLATQGRHYGFGAIWIANQSYKQLTPTIRRNITHFSIHNINLQTELETIAQELRTSTVSTKEMMSLIQKITGSEGYNFLLVCQLRKNDQKYLVNATDVVLI